MSKGDFYFPLFYQRLLTSTVGWTDEEFGAYLRLLIYQFDTGSVPGDPRELKKISKKAAKNWKFFSKKFVKDEQGNFQNLVMKEIRDTIQNKKEVNKLNGKLGGRPSEKNKPNGSENKTERVTETKGILIANSKYIKEEESAEFFELFKQSAPSSIPDEVLRQEVEKLMAKYPGNRAVKSKALVNTWIENLGPIKTPAERGKENFNFV